MKAELEHTKPYEMQIKAEIDKEDVQKKYDEKLEYIRKNYEFKGFRKGKTPLSLIRAKLGNSLDDDLAQEIIPEYIEKITKEKEIKPLTRADIKDFTIKEGDPLAFTATFEVVPDISLEQEQYFALPLTSRPTAATDQEVNERLDTFREEKAVLKPFDGEIDDGIMAYGNLSISSKKDEEKKLEKEEFLVTKGSFVVGELLFSELLGKKRDDMVVKECELPADFESFSKGEDVRIVYRVTSTKRKELPELNDDLAKQIDADVKDLAELKAKLKQNVEAYKKQRNDRYLQEQVKKTLVEKIAVEAPPFLIHMEYANLLNRYGQQMQQLGIGFPSEEAKEQFLQGREEEAQSNVKVDLILTAIADKEKIEVPFKEVKERIDEIVTGRPNSSEMRKELLKDSQFNFLKDEIRQEKTIELIISKATISESDTEEEKTDQEKK